MARVTVEDCLARVSNRFQLALVTVKRAKMLLRGGRPLVATTNKEIVTSLREVAAGEIKLAARETSG
jgi:DNA-directed RNA polymerase subunit omega